MLQNKKQKDTTAGVFLFDKIDISLYYCVMENAKEKKGLRAWLSKMNQKHKRLFEIIRFVIVGGIATVVDMFTMGVVLYLFNPSLYPHFYNVIYGGGDPSTLATVVGTGVGFLVSLLVNYLLSVFFVYEEKGNSKTAKGVILFTVLSLIGLFINMFGMWLGYDICHINEWIVKIIMTLVVLVYNYVTRKLFIFKKVPETEGEQPEAEDQPETETEPAQNDTNAE